MEAAQEMTTIMADGNVNKMNVLMYDVVKM
jgi:hypothetical protein